jgi:sugar phosphate isomerase/epimerase
MNSNRLISLAAGVVQEFPAEQVVRAAADAGFNATGIWCEPDAWSATRTRDVKRALAETDLVPLDLEVVWLQPEERIDAHDKVIDIAMDIGAHNILCVSSEPDDERTIERLRHLCERVGASGPRIVLEFLPITLVTSLQQALNIVAAINHPQAGILVDSLHLQRTGGTPHDLKNLPPDLLPYLQICDCPADIPDSSYESLMEEALYGRLLPGQGQLPLAATLQAVNASLPLSVEIRSRQLIDDFPDSPTARAEAVMHSTRSFLASLEIKDA